MSAFAHRSCRRPARAIGLYAIAGLPLFAGWCYPRTTVDPSEVQGALAENFSVSVPPGYEGKYASSMDTRRYSWSLAIVAPQEVPLDKVAEAPAQHTVFFFGETHVWSVPTAESVEIVELDLYSRLDHLGHLPAAGERTGMAAVELIVGERRVEALRVEETSPLGRLVRYRVPIGDERVMVALGAAERFDEDAMNAILTSVRKRGQPMSGLDKILLLGLLIAVALFAVWKTNLVRRVLSRRHARNARQ